MKKFVLIPDSFKGTLSSTKICEIMAESINQRFAGAEVINIPVADGGEGSVDCFLSAKGGDKIFVECNGPYFDKINGFYALLDGGSTAVVEMAVAAGLPMVEGRENPLLTTTYGVGELILSAVKKGAKKVIVGLGGSCTNDFGCGAAVACGIKFFNKKGEEFIPTGGTLLDIAKIDFSNKDKALEGVEIIAMCDIDNSPFGERGAAKVFAPQKGADERAVKLLDEGVKSLCCLINSSFGIDLSTLKGGGAAGAFGAGMNFFFGAKLMMGIDTVLEVVEFDKVIENADLILTGEGKIDSQSLGGKVVIGVARAGKRKNVPVIAVVGGAEGDMTKAYEQGVSAIFTINKLPQDFSVSRYNSESNLRFAVDNILRALKI